MKKIILFFALFVITAFILNGCKKNIESNLIYSDEIHDLKTINMNSDSLNVVYGYNNDTLYFNGDQALREWAESSLTGYFFTDILDSITVALEIADERNEFDTLDLTGEISAEYEDILEGMIHEGSRGATQLFEHINFGGSSTMIWYPTPYVGRSWNNRTSSIQYASFGGVLCDYRWWGGRKVWYFTLFYGSIKDLTYLNFNDKTTSVWIW